MPLFLPSRLPCPFSHRDSVARSIRVPLNDLGVLGDGPDDPLPIRLFRRWFVAGSSRAVPGNPVYCFSVETPWTRREVEAWFRRVWWLENLTVSTDVRVLRDILDERAL